MQKEAGKFELELQRTIAASPSEAFDGWLDPSCPGTPWSVAEKCILDAKVDGLFYWLFVTKAREDRPHFGRFLVVDRPSKIQYTWVSIHTRGFESIVTVTFKQHGDDTLMTLRHEGLPDDDYGRMHENGWGNFLTQFAEGVAARA